MLLLVASSYQGKSIRAGQRHCARPGAPAQSSRCTAVRAIAHRACRFCIDIANSKSRARVRSGLIDSGPRGWEDDADAARNSPNLRARNLSNELQRCQTVRTLQVKAVTHFDMNQIGGDHARRQWVSSMLPIDPNSRVRMRRCCGGRLHTCAVVVSGALI